MNTMKLILSDRPLRLSVPEGVTYVDLSGLNIANCIGCFGCWTKTPGCCVIRDDAVKVYPLIAKSDTVLYVSRVFCGGYDTVMKTMLERAIPIQKAFIRLHCGETHHVQRAVAPKKAVILAYGTQDSQEQALFRRLIDRNARNMNFSEYSVLFTDENGLENAVENEVKKWQS